MARRILVISLIIFWLAVGALDQRNWWWAVSPIPAITTIKWYVVSLFAVIILLHVFWLNRKALFFYISRNVTIVSICLLSALVCVQAIAGIVGAL
jgi:hypothetical protein